jgi:transcriptional regulator with XRE-family HTH domain
VSTQTNAAVGALVRSLRQQKGLSLEQLAATLATTGHPIGLNSLSKLETNARRITVDDLTALAAALDVHPAALLHPDPGASFS